MKRVWKALAPVGFTLAFAIGAGYGAIYVIETVFEMPVSTGQFRFERPWAACLFPAAALVLLARGYWQNTRAPRLLVSRAFDMQRAGTGKRLKFAGSLAGMRTVAVAMMVVGLMGPQSIHAKDRTDVEGIDIVVAMDLSGSMEAADVAPNRFLASKAVVGQFIARRPNDRIGAVIFGREAYTLLPLTTDHETLRNMVSELELGMIDGRGTAIGNALGVSLNRLRSSHAKTKIVILLTDGNSNSGNVSPDQAADFAKTMHVKVYTILMGQSDEAPQQQGTDLFGNPIFRRAPSPINPELLRNMATHTGGEAYRATDRNGLEQSFHSILDRLERSQIEDAGRVYGELFPAFVGPALILLLLELILAVFVFRRFL